MGERELSPFEGQFTQEDYNTLCQGLCQIATKVPTTIGGKTLGHSGLVIPEQEYITRSEGGVTFNIPEHPGAHPENLSNDAIEREKQFAEHRFKLKEYETCVGMEMGLREVIKRVVPKEHLAGIRDKYSDLNHKTIHEILAFLEVEGAELDDQDVEALSDKLAKAIELEMSPAVYFEEGDKIEDQLLKVGIPRQHKLRLARVIATYQNSGEYEIELAEWKAKAPTDRTFANFRPWIQKKWAKKNSKNHTNVKSAKFAIANNATQAEEEKDAEAALIAELAALMSDKSNEKMEKFMGETTNALTAVTKALEKLSKNNGRGNRNGRGNKEKTKCPHCGAEGLHKADDCWELDKNASKRPAGWKSKKST
jgi:hypothetical protein